MFVAIFQSLQLPEAVFREMTNEEWAQAIAETHRAEREELARRGVFRLRWPALVPAAEARWRARCLRVFRDLAATLDARLYPGLDARAVERLSRYAVETAADERVDGVEHLAEVACLRAANLAAGRDMFDADHLVVPRLMAEGLSRSAAYALRADPRRLGSLEDRRKRRRWRDWMVQHGWKARSAERWLQRQRWSRADPELFAPWKRHGGPITGDLPAGPAFRTHASTTVSYTLTDGSARRLEAVAHNEILWTISPESSEDEMILRQMGFPRFRRR